MEDNLTICSMRKQNVNKANKTAEIDASCHVVGYASETQSKCLSVKCCAHDLQRSKIACNNVQLKSAFFKVYRHTNLI